MTAITRSENINQVERGDIVIVGNGIAGLTAAVEARRLAPGKRIVMITDQSHPTVNTPALKQYAIGKLSREQLLAYPAGTERAQLIHVVNARVDEIHAQERYITMRGGRGLGYEALLIATGSVATGLPANLPGRDFDGVLTLHRLQDYLDLRRRLSEVEEAVVIGGGAHAIETVMSLLYWGIRVHWLIRGETFLSKMLDRPASNMVLESTQRAGALVYTATEAVGIVGRVGAVAGVVTNHQQLLPCQLVLVCTGTSPLTSLARHCDLPIKHQQQGIIVDDQLRTSAQDIYAAGDVAAIRNPQTGQFAPRAQWYAAVQQGHIAATAMTGAPLGEDFGVPWHATRLGELSMLSVGNVLQWQDEITTLTDSSRGSYRRICVVDDRLVGYLSIGSVQPDSLAIKRIIDEGLSIRDIKKELLRGTFDARKYFSRQRTFAAQRMLSTGKIPFELAPRPLTTRKLEAPTTAAPALPPLSPGLPAAPPYVVSTPRPAAFEQSEPLIESEPRLVRVLPSTGPLATPATDAFAGLTGPTIPHKLRNTGEDTELFAIPFAPAPVVGASASTAPRAPKRQFKAPPTKPKKRQGGQFCSPPIYRGGLIEQERARNGKDDQSGQEELTARYPSSSLWSYSSPPIYCGGKMPIAKKGR